MTPLTCSLIHITGRTSPHHQHFNPNRVYDAQHRGFTHAKFHAFETIFSLFFHFCRTIAPNILRRQPSLRSSSSYLSIVLFSYIIFIIKYEKVFNNSTFYWNSKMSFRIKYVRSRWEERGPLTASVGNWITLSSVNLHLLLKQKGRPWFWPGSPRIQLRLQYGWWAKCDGSTNSCTKVQCWAPNRCSFPKEADCYY